MKERIGFFGGCFNPVTNAHIKLIEESIEKENLNKVYFVPMGDNYEKQELLEFKHRKNMLELAIKNNDKMYVLDILSNESKKLYAIDSFKIIDRLFQDSDRYFIMGTDNYMNINSWKDSNELLKNYKYIILDRNTSSNTNSISSSNIRKRIKTGESVDGLIPCEVKEYIFKNKLYQ